MTVASFHRQRTQGFCFECFSGLYFRDIWGVLPDQLESRPYGGCMHDYRDGLVEQVWSHDRSWEIVGDYSNPKWVRTDYLY